MATQSGAVAKCVRKRFAVTLEDLADYICLMKSFVDGKLTPSDFETKYRTLFLSDSRLFPQEVFDILNTVFTDGDAYVEDPTLRESNDLDAGTYKHRCGIHLRCLEELLPTKKD
jgi:hypothetical protein